MTNKAFLIVFGIFWIVNQTFEIQMNFGNYLKHVHPKSKLRKIWWSMCDQNGYCSFCMEDYVNFYEILIRNNPKVAKDGVTVNQKKNHES